MNELERLAEADHRAALSYGADLLRRLVDPEHHARVRRAMGNSYRALAKLDPAMEQYEAGIGVATAADLGEHRGLLLMSRAGAYSIMGDRRRALAAVRAFLHFRNRLGRSRSFHQPTVGDLVAAI